MRQFLRPKNFVRRLDQQRHNFQTMKEMNANYVDNIKQTTKNNAFLNLVPLFRLIFFFCSLQK